MNASLSRAMARLRRGRWDWLLLVALALMSSAGWADEHGPSVAGVYPSASEVPENLLRISIAFREAPANGGLEDLRLTRADGSPITGVFYFQPLWSPDGLTLTVYLDPGRVKTGLDAHEQGGRALAQKDAVKLWHGQHMIKHWRITPALIAPLDLRRWRVQTPSPGTRQPLRVEFPTPIDWQALPLVAIEAPDGTRLSGSGQLSAGETVWTFVPDAGWVAGAYHLRVHPELEDPQGNRVGEAFEHIPRRRDAPVSLRMPFTLNHNPRGATRR